MIAEEAEKAYVAEKARVVAKQEEKTRTAEEAAKKQRRN